VNVRVDLPDRGQSGGVKILDFCPTIGRIGLPFLESYSQPNWFEALLSKPQNNVHEWQLVAMMR